MQKLAQEAAKMLRWQKMRGGIVAVAGRKTWINTKAVKNAPESTRRVMMRPSFHFVG